ncbi:hypothetical protein GQ53DRAFT_819450 [Thozetella sp. PMI_491]|nr:hypothetical protein GQ53DRAFT_819450 [Thozetella sp. PMI_491]
MPARILASELRVPLTSRDLRNLDAFQLTGDIESENDSNSDGANSSENGNESDSESSSDSIVNEAPIYKLTKDRDNKYQARRLLDQGSSSKLFRLVDNELSASAAFFPSKTKLSTWFGKRTVAVRSAFQPSNTAPGFQDEVTQKILQTIMQKFCTSQGQQWQSPSSGTKNSANNCPNAVNNAELGRGGSGETRRAKRRRNVERDESDDEDGREDHQPPQDAGDSNQIKGTDPDIRLACPFRKRDPFTFSIGTRRTCASGHWPTVARVKYA